MIGIAQAQQAPPAENEDADKQVQTETNGGEEPGQKKRKKGETPKSDTPAASSAAGGDGLDLNKMLADARKQIEGEGNVTS